MDKPIPEAVLLPCPMCGSDAALNTCRTTESEFIRLNGRDTGYGVNCVTCGLNNRGFAYGYATPAEAITAWNRRALAAPPPAAAQQQGLTEAWQDEWRSAVAAKLSSYGLSEEAAAVFAESELGEYRAGLCDCAENEPADMVDLMMGVALDAIEKWKAESAGRPFGYKRTAPPSAPDYPITATCRVCDCDYRCVPIPAKCGACGADLPPSAPVGVKTLSEFMAEQEALHPGIHDKVQAATDELRASLAQQPAAVDGAAVERALAAYLRRQEDGDSLYGCVTAALTAALATKHQEPKKSKAKA